MAEARDWRSERYRSLLHLQVRLLQLDPQFRRRFDSSDLVQEALLKAHKYRERFGGGTEPAYVGWLQEILRNVARDKVREATAGKRIVRLEKSLDAAVAESSARIQQFLATDSPSPSEQAERREQALRLAAALERLPQDQRDVIVRRKLDGEPVDRIAAQLGRTEKAVAGLLLRGLRKLRELMAGPDEPNAG
jgi:RNA polymerase sigma-70 factor (ECF subfamily)